MTQWALIIGSIYGLLGVVLGAFGAHALSARLSPDMQAIWHTGVQYQFYHGLALLVIGCLARQGLGGAALATATSCFALGTLVFSASLYLLALTGVRWLGAITPIGGVLMIIGWIALLFALARA